MELCTNIINCDTQESALTIATLTEKLKGHWRIYDDFFARAKFSLEQRRTRYRRAREEKDQLRSERLSQRE